MSCREREGGGGRGRGGGGERETGPPVIIKPFLDRLKQHWMDKTITRKNESSKIIDTGRYCQLCFQNGCHMCVCSLLYT